MHKEFGEGSEGTKIRSLEPSICCTFEGSGEWVQASMTPTSMPSRTESVTFFLVVLTALFVATLLQRELIADPVGTCKELDVEYSDSARD